VASQVELNVPPNTSTGIPLRSKRCEVNNLKSVLLQRLHFVARRLESVEFIHEIPDDHYPEFEPYASMGRDQIVELMDQAFRANDVTKWFMLDEFLHDKMSTEELNVDNLAMGLATKAIQDAGIHGCSGEKSEALVRLAYDLASLALSDEEGVSK
jgi:hypothetical protein